MTDNPNTTTTAPAIISGGYPPALEEMRSWIPLMRKLQGVGKSEGMSVVTVHIIVNKDGQAQHWTAPSVCHIEPKRRGPELEALLRALAG